MTSRSEGFIGNLRNGSLLPPVQMTTSPLPRTVAEPAAPEHSISTTSRHQHNPLHVALNNGFTGQVKLALQSGADPNGVDDLGNSPLHIIAMRFSKFEHSLELAGILLNAGGDANGRDSSGRVALSVIINEYTTFPFSRAAYLGLVDLLLSHNADMNSPDDCGWTPIHWCCFYADGELLQVLLQKPHCDLNVQTKSSTKGICALSTPLHIATVKNGMLAMVLLGNGASTTLTDEHGWLPLHLAMDIFTDKHMDLVHALTTPPSNVNQITTAAKKTSNVKAGYTPLHIAVFKQKPDLIQLLLEQGAAIHTQEQGGDTARTPFDLALLVETLSGLNNHMGLWMLVSAGAMVTTNDDDPHYLLDTVLTFEQHVVTNYGYTQLFRALIQAGYHFHTTMLFMGGVLESDEILEQLLEQQVYPRPLSSLSAAVVRQNLYPNAWIGAGQLDIKPELKQTITLGYYSEVS